MRRWRWRRKRRRRTSALGARARGLAGRGGVGARRRGGGGGVHVYTGPTVAVACMYRQDPAVACMYRQDPKQTLRDAPAPVCARTCLAAAATRSGGRAGARQSTGCAPGAPNMAWKRSSIAWPPPPASPARAAPRCAAGAGGSEGRGNFKIDIVSTSSGMVTIWSRSWPGSTTKPRGSSAMYACSCSSWHARRASSHSLFGYASSYVRPPCRTRRVCPLALMGRRAAAAASAAVSAAAPNPRCAPRPAPSRARRRPRAGRGEAEATGAGAPRRACPISTG